MPRLLLKLALSCLLLSATSMLAGAEEKPVKLSPAELKTLNVFLSDICELGFLNFDLEASGSDELLHLGGASAAPDLIRFGVWHNYLNHFKESIQQPSGAEAGRSLQIDAKVVAATVEQYFGLSFVPQSVAGSDPGFVYDGHSYHFEGADGEVYYHARVKTVLQTEGSVLKVTGEIYDIEGDGERLGDFEAWLKPKAGQSNKAWTVQKLTTAFDRY